jgi:predicted Zn-ribbon and HTH transcriptional regulator
MNTTFVDILKKLTAEQGKEAMLNPAKCKAFLADYTKGEYKKESRLLLQALEAGVQKEIITTVELEICKKQQIRILHEEHFLTAEAAVDVVDTLTLILREEQKNKISQGMLCANCGKELQKEWKVCPYCGTSTVNIQQNPPQSELPTDNELDNIIQAATFLTPQTYEDLPLLEVLPPLGIPTPAAKPEQTPDTGTVLAWIVVLGFIIFLIIGASILGG